MCAIGYREHGERGECVPTCEAAGFADCSGHGTCDDTGGVATCTCDATRTGAQCESCADGLQDHDEDGTCTPTCETAALGCAGHTTSDDLSGTAACVCLEGYAREAHDACDVGYQSHEGDDLCVRTCAHPDVVCDPNATCDDTTGPATCACNVGYENDGLAYTMSAPSPVTAGLVSRYDTRIAGSLTVIEGNDGAGLVLAWRNVGAQGRDLTSCVVAPQLAVAGINGHPAVDFAGDDAAMTATLPLPEHPTVFLVVRIATPEVYGALAHHGDRDYDRAGRGGLRQPRAFRATHLARSVPLYQVCMYEELGYRPSPSPL